MSMICLFDMDGTLKPARQPMPETVLNALKRLSDFADIGIVSGSPMNYISEQSQEFLQYFDRGTDCGETFIMPCNGTQLYKSQGNGWVKKHSADMRKEVGPKDYRNIILACNEAHNIYLTGWSDDNIPPLTGNFISYRESLLNFCPIGRDASDHDRKVFMHYDKQFEIRASLKDNLLNTLSSYDINNISCTLGGNTSIDVYPDGWDKTYCLNHLGAYSNITFVGDRCTPDGNDFTLYNMLSPNSYKTQSMEKTVDIINNILIPMAKKRMN